MRQTKKIYSQRSNYQRRGGPAHSGAGAVLMLEHAIKYHRMGVGVIPLWPGAKKPILTRWEPYQRRRPTEQEIRGWWQRWPDANIGIVTGLVSGLVVLDIDSEEGNESLKGRHMPATAAVQTIKGYHYYWQHPGGSGLGNWVRKMPGCDLRADGGYVVAPPSVHPSGERYEWMIEMESREALAEAPLWLIEMCGAKHLAVALPEEDEWYTQALKGAKEGQRNDLAARLAGRYLAMGMSRSETEVFMLAWNKKNKPPLPEAELIRTINSIARRDHTRRVSESLVSGEDVEINAMNNTISIMEALEYTREGVSVKDTKNKSSYRNIYIPEEVMNILRWHKSNSTSEHVCTNKDGGRLSPATVTHCFPELLERKGLRHIRYHDLRHSHGTYLAMMGVPAKVIQQRLGHSTITTTMDIYGHVLPEMGKDASDKIGKLFG
jgi:integrase